MAKTIHSIPGGVKRKSYSVARGPVLEKESAGARNYTREQGRAPERSGHLPDVRGHHAHLITAAAPRVHDLEVMRIQLVGRTPRSAADPLVGLLFWVRNPPFSPNYPGMTLYPRRLPHDYETDQPVFLTWRLHDSLPSHRDFPTAALNSGQAFVALDRLLDEACVGPFYLRQPAVADMIVDAIQYNADILGHYVLHAFAVMPNHVHLLATPGVALPKLTKSLKGITSKRANAMLAMTGSAFWQEESYDHLVRH